jgi:hypothetical protein
MEPYEINLSLVAGTAGTYAVAYSPPRGDWLVCRITHRPGDHSAWLFVESDPTECGARKIAHALYVGDLGRQVAQ